MNIKIFVIVCAVSLAQCLDVGTLQLPIPTFDPQHPQVRQLLTEALGVHAIDVQPLKANVGLNGGVWVVSDPHRTWDDIIVKLRPVEHDYFPSHPPEAVHFPNIYREHPGLANDPDVIFPSKILGYAGPDGTKQGDIIVMKKAPGMTLAFYIAQQFWQGPQGRTELMTVFESIGKQLRTFHETYDNKQHSDFQAANIMVDGSSGNKITFIDLGGMGLPIGDNDILHLKECLTMLSDAYPGIMELAKRHFETGYYHGQRQAQAQSQTQAQDQVQAQAQGQASKGAYMVGDAVDVWSNSRGWWFSDGQVLMVNEGSITVTFDGGRLTKSIAADSIEMQKKEPMLEMLIGRVEEVETPFHVTVSNTSGKKLGLKLVNSDGVAVIKTVQDGLISDWNANHLGLQVKAGDRIIEVNQRRDGYQEIIELCRGSDVLDLLVQRAAIPVRS